MNRACMIEKFTRCALREKIRKGRVPENFMRYSGGDGQGRLRTVRCGYIITIDISGLWRLNLKIYSAFKVRFTTLLNVTTCHTLMFMVHYAWNFVAHSILERFRGWLRLAVTYGSLGLGITVQPLFKTVSVCFVWQLRRFNDLRGSGSCRIDCHGPRLALLFEATAFLHLEVRCVSRSWLFTLIM